MCKHCWDDTETDHHKDFIRGGVPIDDFEKEVNYQKNIKKKNKKTREKSRPGCPGNEYKAHVYVWTTEYESNDFFSDYYGFPRTQHRICAGCGKSNGSKPSDEYMKIKERKWAKLAIPEKGIPVSRWRYRSRHSLVTFKYWSWEYDDEDYRKARREFIDLHGWPSYLYNF